MSEYPTITGDFREFRGETNVMVRMMGEDLQKLDRELSKTKRELSEVKLDLQHLKGKIAVLAAVIGSGGGLAASFVGKLF
jgi:archaellum component FlaC